MKASKDMKSEYKNRMRRLLKIVVEIKTVPFQTVPELIEKLGVSKAQFYKDRGLLKEIGFQFEYVRSLGKFRVERDIALPVENLTISEQLSLIMALRQLSAAGDHILTFEGLKAAQKLASDLPSPFRESLFEGFVLNEGFGCTRKVMDKIQNAIAENWRVSMTYTRPGQAAPSEETVDPYHIFFKRRALYVEGYSVSESGIRVYRMNRIGDVTLKERGFAPKPGYDFGKRYRNAFSAFPGDETEHVKIRFSGRVRPFIEEAFWHQSQKTTINPDGSLDFEVDVAYPREVMWWAFGWGADAEVVEPDWLRAEAKAEVAKMAEIYK